MSKINPTVVVGIFIGLLLIFGVQQAIASSKWKGVAEQAQAQAQVAQQSADLAKVRAAEARNVAEASQEAFDSLSAQAALERARSDERLQALGGRLSASEAETDALLAELGDSIPPQVVPLIAGLNEQIAVLKEEVTVLTQQRDNERTERRAAEALAVQWRMDAESAHEEAELRLIANDRLREAVDALEKANSGFGFRIKADLLIGAVGFAAGVLISR